MPRAAQFAAKRSTHQRLEMVAPWPQLTLVHVARFKDEMRAFPTEFKGDLLEITLSSRLHNFATCDRRPSEGNLVDIGMGRQGSSSNRAERGDGIQNTGRKSGGFIRARGRSTSTPEILVALITSRIWLKSYLLPDMARISTRISV